MENGNDKEEKVGGGLSAAVNDLDELLDSLSVSSRGEEMSETDDDYGTITTVETLGSTATLDTMDDIFDDVTVCSLDVTIPELYDADESVANDTPRCLTPTTPPSNARSPTLMTPWLPSTPKTSDPRQVSDAATDGYRGSPSTSKEMTTTTPLDPRCQAADQTVEEGAIKPENETTTMATPPETTLNSESEATDPPSHSSSAENSGENNVVCVECGQALVGCIYYSLNDAVYCEVCVDTTLKDCCVCTKKIKGEILKAGGNFYHPPCFTCEGCQRNLDGVQFTRDATNSIFCIQCYQLRYCPRCAACEELITGSNEKGEILHVVSMDTTFHTECYKCEECHVQLSSEAGRACYPLNGHLLCQKCNMVRQTASKSAIIPSTGSDLKPSIESGYGTLPRHINKSGESDRSTDDKASEDSASENVPKQKKSPPPAVKAKPANFSEDDVFESDSEKNEREESPVNCPPPDEIPNLDQGKDVFNFPEPPPVIEEGSGKKPSGICGKCGEEIVVEGSVYTAVGADMYHVTCYVCEGCGAVLTGTVFFNGNEGPFCESCGTTFEICVACENKIQDKMLKANNSYYHPECFACSDCLMNMNGMEFTVDESKGNILCIDCYQARHCPRCGACDELITASNEKGEILHVVAMDKTYHMECYKCDECGVMLSSEKGKACYPLDGHFLCQPCNILRRRAVSKKDVTSEL